MSSAPVGELPGGIRPPAEGMAGSPLVAQLSVAEGTFADLAAASSDSAPISGTAAVGEVAPPEAPAGTPPLVPVHPLPDPLPVAPAPVPAGPAPTASGATAASSWGGPLGASGLPAAVLTGEVPTWPAGSGVLVRGSALGEVRGGADDPGSRPG